MAEKKEMTVEERKAEYLKSVGAYQKKIFIIGTDENQWEFEGKTGTSYKLLIDGGSCTIKQKVTEKLYNKCQDLLFSECVMSFRLSGDKAGFDIEILDISAV